MWGQAAFETKEQSKGKKEQCLLLLFIHLVVQRLDKAPLQLSSFFLPHGMAFVRDARAGCVCVCVRV